MTREEEAILRARSRWHPDQRRTNGEKAQFFYSLIGASDGLMEEVIAPWRTPPSKSPEWSWARRTPDWDKATVELLGVDE